MLHPTIKPLSERALLISFGETISEETHHVIQQTVALIQAQNLAGIEVTSSYTSICVYYEPLLLKKLVAPFFGQTTSQKLAAYFELVLQQLTTKAATTGRVIDIPVRYGGEWGPDLDEVARYHKMTPDEVIALHAAGDYFVYMLGFAPGFPFLGGLAPQIATPRRETPRLQIAAGSVGIAGAQTGIYPLATPGGWQIIGRTETKLFLPEQHPPTLLNAGDRVRFVAVKEEEGC